jgi:hypothetical protein
MYETLARTVLLEEDARVAREVERVRSRHPRSSDGEVVRRLTKRVAWRCAAVGAVASAGEPLFPRLASAADLSFQALSLNRLAQSIALARRRPTTIVERGVAAAASLLIASGAAALRRGAGRAARSALASRSDFAPLLTALAGGAAAYVSARLVSRALEEYFASHPKRKW